MKNIVKLIKPVEIVGQVDYLTANYIVLRFKEILDSPDAKEFAELLLQECER